MSADIGELIKNRFKNLSEFSRLSGVPYGTLYDIASGKTKVEKIGIGVFMKIAHSLGMTAEELYYGEPRRIEYADPRQEQMNGCYETLNEESKEIIAGVVASFAADADRRTVKDAPWLGDAEEPMEGVA